LSRSQRTARRTGRAATSWSGIECAQMLASR
jgi:hypothetical protein